jgi:multidrug efflux pump subunit AcrA (membrane-fusion protein)
LKPLRIIVFALLLGVTITAATGCRGNVDPETEPQEEVIATIQRGDLSLDVSAIGNLVLSEKKVLTFELGGTVTDILVDEGDYVEPDQVLAKLDITERDAYLKTLTKAIELKDQALLQADINYTNAEKAFEAINSQSYREQKIAQAKLDVISAETALENAENAYEAAEDLYEQNWSVPERIRNYEQKKIQLAMAERALSDAQEALADIDDTIALEIEIKEKECVIARSKLEDARKDYNDAVSDLEEAQTQSWELKAPFAGFITKVNITEGQDIQKSTAAVELANPDEFEADVLVSEIDIANITVGSTATMQVDAFSDMYLPAEVVRISPTAVIQSGVVNYTVKVKITNADLSMMSMNEEMFGGFEGTSENLEPGELPERLKNAVEEGLMTQEQAEKMAEMMESGVSQVRPGLPEGSMQPPDVVTEEFTVPSMAAEGEIKVFTSPAGVDSFAQVGFSDTDVQLREGLTVTVSIFTDSRTDVLVVPSGAVRTDMGKYYVTIVNTDGTREDREIEIGLSDWQNTEVLSGLVEGEQVAYTPVSETSYDPYGGMFMAPGGGGVIVRSETVK